mgnify:CR=1 FL=1
MGLGKIKKLKKAVDKIEIDREKRKDQRWKAVGMLITNSQSLEVAPEDEKYIDSDLSLSENIQNCFKKAKDQEKKLLGAEERITELKSEIEALEKGDSSSFKTTNFDLMKKSQTKGRRLELEPGVVVSVGKSAADNLKLLRAARAWDYWMHLKDLPSAHAILQRERGQKLSPKLMQAAAQFLIKMNYGSKGDQKKGEAFDILFVESRFVRPIKGSKTGSVNFSNETVLRIVYEP